AIWGWRSRTRTAATGTPTRARPRRRAALLSGLDLLGQVVPFARLRDQAHLGFDPVRVVLLTFQHLLEELPGAVIARASGRLDARVEEADRVTLELEVEAELLGHGLADVHLPESLDVRHAFEIQDPLDELVGVAHLTERLFADLLPQTLVAPVLAHPSVDEVLVDRGELGREDLVQEGDDLLGASHSSPLTLRTDSGARPL